MRRDHILAEKMYTIKQKKLNKQRQQKNTAENFEFTVPLELERRRPALLIRWHYYALRAVQVAIVYR